MTQPVEARPTHPAQRFPIRFTGANKTMAMIGVTRASSYVELDDTELHVRLGWAFTARVPRSSVCSATEDQDRVLGWGAHGWGGSWLVNGSSSGIVRVEIDPAGRAHVLGWPVRLAVLRVSVDDPDGLIAALTSPAGSTDDHRSS